MKRVIYTAIFGGIDSLKFQPAAAGNFVAFLDRSKIPISPPWEIRYPAVASDTDRRKAKRFKILSHEALPDCEYSLWIDGTVVLAPDFSLDRMIEQYLGESDIAVFGHHTRRCIYEEAWECIRQELDDELAIYQQVFRYTNIGYPPNRGIFDGSVILRRHTPAIRRFNERWWEEICAGSHRDQISLPVVLRELKLPVSLIEGTSRTNDYLTIFPHSPERLCRPDSVRGKAYAAFGRVCWFLKGLAPGLYEKGKLRYQRMAPRHFRRMQRIRRFSHLRK